MLQSLKKIEKDTWVMLLLIVVTTYTIFNLKHWNNAERIIAWDVVSYYGFLPATFIYDDVTLENPNEKFEQFDHTFWYHEKDDGKKVFKTSLGMAILYTPFFFASHYYTIACDGIASGYSPPYKFGIVMSSLFYLIIGFIFLRKFLRTYFSTNVVALTLLFVGLGTNLYYYSVIGVGMPHIYLFSLLTVFMHSIIKWYKTPTYKLSLFLGLLAGLMVLVRPTMIIVALFAILVNVYSVANIKERLLFYKTHYLKLLTVLFFSFIVWVPQLLYWKLASGNYLFYSYTEEGFFFSDPQIFNALFSFRKGWLLYTPIMIFALIGLIRMIIKKEKLALSLTITVAVYFYVASCWWDWWFGGSFGYRTMIDVFPLLAIGMAYIIQEILQYSKIYKIAGLTSLFLLLGLNLFQTRQAHEGLIHHDSMSKTAYFKILFKLQSQITREEIKPFLNTPDYDAAKKGNRN